MIISHRHRFIFLKTRKTAGTSVETALSKVCGDEDVITPLLPREDELARVEFAGRGAQNAKIPLRRSVAALRELNPKRPHRPRFYNHMPATTVQKSVSEQVWNEYFKFSIVRNPFDQIISAYYFAMRTKTHPIPLETWIMTGSHRSNWPIYTIDDQVVTDYMIRYEMLADGLAAVSDQLGVNITLPQRHSKGGIRPDRRPPSEVLSDRALAHITQLHGDELQHWGYVHPDM